MHRNKRRTFPAGRGRVSSARVGAAAPSLVFVGRTVVNPPRDPVAVVVIFVRVADVSACTSSRAWSFSRLPWRFVGAVVGMIATTALLTVTTLLSKVVPIAAPSSRVVVPAAGHDRGCLAGCC